MSSAPPPPYSEKAENNYSQPIYTEPIVFNHLPMFGEYPASCKCPSCSQQIVTRTEKKNGIFVWLICGILFIFGLWCCCCIPFCIDSAKDTQHFCPNCNNLIGVDKKI